MAIDKSIWEQVKADFEAGIVEEDKAFTHLSETYKIDRSTISKKAKKDGWVFGKNSHIITLEATTISNLQKIQSEKSQLNHTEITTIDRAVRRELQKEIINDKTFHLAEIIQAQLIEAIPCMKIDDLKPKDITSALKDINDIVNPKVDTSINIQNSNNQQTNIEVENMSQKEIINAYMDIVKK